MRKKTIYRQCYKCKVTKTIFEFSALRKGVDGYARCCKACGYNSSLKTKQLVVEKYGDSTCQCCGEKQLEFLTLDHIGGRKTREKLGHIGRQFKGRAMYRYLIRQSFPDKRHMRVLCMNCNMATKGGKICPHQIAKMMEA